MHISLRIPSETNEKLQRLALKTGKTKTDLILEAVDEKYNLKKKRSLLIRESAGWLSSEEGALLRSAVSDFDTVHEQDWP